MKDYLKNIPEIIKGIESVRDTIITNIVLVGEKSAPTFHEDERVSTFMNRLAMVHIDECTTDGFGNPVGIIRGTMPEKSQIFAVAHLDTFLDQVFETSYSVKKNTIYGPGVSDNSAGVGILISLPTILRKLGIKLQSDLVLAGVKESIGRGNLGGIRHLLKTWPAKICGAVCIEGVELGRLNYFSKGMIRAEIVCNCTYSGKMAQTREINAILVINEIINKILELRLPQKPHSSIVIGRISGGFNHGKKAKKASIGLEIRSDADDIVNEIFEDVKDIVDSFGRFYNVDLKFETISNLHAAGLEFNHPLVKSATEVMHALGLEPVIKSSESDLSILLSNQIPCVTIGMTRVAKFKQESSIEIEPMFKGIALLIGILMAIDQGNYDGKKLA